MSMSAEKTHKRRIRSYVRREGRMTPAQRRRLEQTWPQYGLSETGGPLNWVEVFGRDAPRTLEVGFGKGENLLALAAAAPEEDFIGIEVYKTGTGRLLRRLEEEGVTNVRLFLADAVEVMRRRIPAASIDRLLILFPDPWPKKRHHKRRLVQPAFADLAAEVLKSDGLWHLATDWAPYAQQMRQVLDAHPEFVAADVEPDARDETRFERRGRKLGHEVTDLVYRRS